MTGLESLPQLAVNGLILGSILTLSAIGLSLVYGVLRLANFAHGDLVTLGAYLALMAFTMTSMGPGGALFTSALLVGSLAFLAWPLVPPRRRRWLGLAALALLYPASLLFRSGADILAWRLEPLRLAPLVGVGLAAPLVPFLALAIARKARRGRPMTAAFPSGVAAGAGGTLFASLLDPGPLTIAVLEGAFLALAAVGGVLLAARRGEFERFWLYASGVLAFGVAGAFAGWGLNLGLVLALLLAAAIAAGLAAGVDRVLWRPMRARHAALVTFLIATIGLALVLRNGIVVAFGAGIRRFPLASARDHDVHGLDVGDAEIVVLLLSLFLALATHILLRYTRLGKAMRALADNPELARISGINTDRVIMATWALAAALAAVAGVLLGLERSFTPGLGFALLLLMFASVILGGIGSPYGAMLGGFLIGLATELSAAWVPVPYKQAIGFAIMIAVLFVRPRGLMGGAT